jgi:glycerol-3-phosphate dehydrogenase
VIVIGAGSTGAATAHDLALRGVRVTVLDRAGVASGTTGRNHCLLHSGGRYCVNDQDSAVECIAENTILRRIMPGLMELNGGLFVALTEEDLAFKERFLEGCALCHIPAREVSHEHVLRMEPLLNRGLLAAVQVPDGVFDPYRFCLALLASAEQRGAVVRPYTPVTDLLLDGRTVSGVRVRDLRTLRTEAICADLVVNAAGPWAGQVALMAGLDVPVVPTAGVMVTVARRVSNLVLNRLNKPSDGDIVVPQRRTSIIGTTSWKVDSADAIPIPPEHVEKMVRTGEQLVPTIRQTGIRGVAAAARPLVSKGGADLREVSRTFECFDHAGEGVAGLVTVAGGKMTTARAMGEAVSDLVCGLLSVEVPCRTREVPLASHRWFREWGGIAS